MGRLGPHLGPALVGITSDRVSNSRAVRYRGRARRRNRRHAEARHSRRGSPKLKAAQPSVRMSAGIDHSVPHHRPGHRVRNQSPAVAFAVENLVRTMARVSSLPVAATRRHTAFRVLNRPPRRTNEGFSRTWPYGKRRGDKNEGAGTLHPHILVARSR